MKVWNSQRKQFIFNFRILLPEAFLFKINKKTKLNMIAVVNEGVEKLIKEAERKKELALQIKKLFESSDEISDEILKESKQLWEEFGFTEEMSKITNRKLAIQILQMFEDKLDEILLLLSNKVNPTQEETKRKDRDPKVADYFHRRIRFGMKTDSVEALSYVTPYRQARDVSHHILKQFETQFHNIPTHIYDATGGIGGNTFGFVDILRKYYCTQQVNLRSFEMDSNRCNCLRDNLKVYLKEYSRQDMRKISTQVLEGNFLELWKEIPQNERTNSLVLIDAPWGNSDYSKHSIIYDLYLFDNETQKSVNEISHELLYNDGVSMVVLKVPMHYSEMNLVSNSEKVKVESYLLRKSKYLIIYK